MTPKEALEAAKKSKQEPGLFKVSFGWGASFLMPHKAAVQILDALALAEKYESEYHCPKIKPMDSNSIFITPFSREEYLKLKTASLLQIDLDELPEDLVIA